MGRGEASGPFRPQSGLQSDSLLRLLFAGAENILATKRLRLTTQSLGSSPCLPPVSLGCPDSPVPRPQYLLSSTEQGSEPPLDILLLKMTLLLNREGKGPGGCEYPAPGQSHRLGIGRGTAAHSPGGWI